MPPLLPEFLDGENGALLLLVLEFQLLPLPALELTFTLTMVLVGSIAMLYMGYWKFGLSFARIGMCGLVPGISKRSNKSLLMFRGPSVFQRAKEASWRWMPPLPCGSLRKMLWSWIATSWSWLLGLNFLVVAGIICGALIFGVFL